MGSELGVGGHLIALRRTVVAPFEIGDCLPWELAAPMDTAVGIGKILPIRTLDPVELKEISFGRFISPSDTEGATAAITGAGSFVALLENREVSGKVLAAPTLVSIK